MPAVMQIVDKVGASGATLFDLNRHAAGALLGPRADISLAEVEVAKLTGQEFAWSPVPDPLAPVELRSRQITFPVVLFGGTPDAAEAVQRQLQRLVRGRWILKVQRHGASTPVWLRCAPCVPKLSTPIAGIGGSAGTVRHIVGTITTQTDPYALGARVDVGPFTVTQNPAAGTPFVFDVNGVGGTDPTPLVLRSSDAAVTGVVDRILVSTRRRGVPANLTGLTAQAEAGTTTLGTAPPALSTLTGDAALSGGGGIRATYTTAASGPWSVTVTFPSLTGVEVTGQYRVLARVRRSGAAAGQLFSLVATVGPARLVEPVIAGGNDLRTVDLGLVQLPAGSPPYMSAPESPDQAQGPSVTLTVVRAAAGTGEFDVDWVALIPADQDTGMLEVAAPVTGTIAVDGYDHTPRLFSADPYTGVNPAAVSTSGLAFVGGAPRVRPGDNRLYVVAGLGTDVASARTLAASLTFSGSYWARYSWLA